VLQGETTAFCRQKQVPNAAALACRRVLIVSLVAGADACCRMRVQGDDKRCAAVAIQRVIRGYFSRVSGKSFPALWLGYMRPKVDQHGTIAATGMWVYDRAYSQLPLPSLDVLHALADQEQKSPQKSLSSPAAGTKAARMPGLDAPRASQAPEAAVRSLCARLCASGAYVDDNMSDVMRRQLANHGVPVVMSCLKFGAAAQVTCNM
jgi:hypothetical protein